VGQPIFHAAIEAARKMTNRRWRLLVGGQDAVARIAELSKQAQGALVTLEPVRRDFRQMLPRAAASVSMCGYNTAMDLLQSGCPSVLIPFDDGGEVEQSLRTQSLSDLPAFGVLPSKNLTGQTLVDAVAKVIQDGPRAPQLQGMNGAQRSVQIVAELRDAKR
jgi:predicted glycosyltransferase